MSRARQLADSADLSFDDGTLVIDSANNNVGIGTATPNSYANQTVLTINGTDYGRLDLEASGTKKGSVFGGGDGLYLDAGVNQVLMFAGGSEAMRIDSSGNLLVGKTSSGTQNTADGFELRQSGYLFVTKSSDTVAYFNRRTTDGNIAEFRKDGSTVGSIGVASSDLYIGEGTVNLRFDGENARIFPATTAGAVSDASLDLGADTVRFKDLYLSGGVYLGGTTSTNYLDDYEEGTFSPALQAVSASTNSGAANYVKIGKMVFCRGYIEWSGLNTGDASAFQFGLPFTADTSDSGGSGSVAAQFTMDTRYTTGFTGDLPDVHGARVIGGTFVLTRLETDFAYNNGVDASGAFVFHFSYRATT